MSFADLSSELLGIDPQQMKQRSEQASTLQSAAGEAFNAFIERQRSLIERLQADELRDERRAAEKAKEKADGATVEKVSEERKSSNKAQPDKADVVDDVMSRIEAAMNDRVKSKPTTSKDGPSL